MGMEVKKGPALALIFLAMILHTNTSIGRATATLVMMRSNRSNGGCKGRLEECLIGDMDLDEELLIMDSEISRRMVLNFGNAVTEGTNKATQKAVACLPGKPYKNCLPPRNHKPPHENCGTYKRECYPWRDVIKLLIEKERYHRIENWGRERYQIGKQACKWGVSNHYFHSNRYHVKLLIFLKILSL